MVRAYSRRQLAVVSLILVSFIYTLLNVASRFLALEFESFTQVYLRILLGFLIGTILFKRNINFPKIKSTSIKDWCWLFLMGVVGYSVFVYLITLGAINTKLINVSIIYSTFIFFVYILSAFFLKENYDKKIIVMLAASFWGMVMLTTNNIMPTNLTLNKGDIYVFLSAAAFSLFILGRKKLSNDLNNEEITVVVMAIAFVTSFVFAYILGQSVELVNFTNPLVLLGLIIGGIGNIVSTFLENFAFEHLSSVIGSQLLLSENIFSLIIGYILYNETISFIQVFGVTVVIGSVYYTNILLNSR